MEIVKEYAGSINPHWIAVVATGMYTHLRQICIIGLCFEEENNSPYDPSYASVLFTFSVLCVLAEYKLWPRTLKEPPVQLLYIYELFRLNSILGLGRYSYLTSFAYYMARDCAATHMALCTSLLSFVWMLDATESLDAILDTWAK
ncbi:hypothetical protein KM043_014623 [Ampulex compressa]|nr:hypothetical protein KM043_014623 [Ampulex compressa]